MHPAPSLAEAFPKSDDGRAQQQQPPHGQTTGQQHIRAQLDQQQPGTPNLLDHHSPASSSRSPQPIRKDTNSSTSTSATDATLVSTDSNSTASAYSVESSQSIFSIKDGSDVSHNRRASRRRTGPLSAQQREKAALIRKLGACQDCRRRRVACHPNHHNLTWEDAMRKYRSHSPMQELAPLAGRPLSPRPNHVRHAFTQDPQEMDIDSTPTPPGTQTTPGRAPLSDSRIRTPLPSGPRLDKSLSMPPLVARPPTLATLPNIDFIKSELESSASRILAGPHRGRYSTVLALLICWQEDEEPGVTAAIQELGDVFDKYYHFTFEIIKIPPVSSDAYKSPSRWLSRVINDFTDNSDTRDVLKIVYYNGCSYLDDNREMVLASSGDRERATTIRWGSIEQTLEDACSDTLLIIDAAYFPSAKMVRQMGMLELIAASASEEHFNILGRSSFTRALAEQLRTRAVQRLPNAPSAAELHARLLSIYPRIIQDKHPERESTASTPLPLHVQVSGSSRLPSITLSPLQPRTPLYSPEMPSGPHLSLSIRLTDDHIDTDCWIEWLRQMPDGVKDIKVEGPYRMLR
ncbi:uncharacterized protein BCR38DRAFT_354986 [Pseudomassariella vexata]|uniref:Uncharacterized protein n=1 Tax=Pseudomassariella vexata TaxID=1141098 RepID=A0A1Y2DCZ8_9PEZI|nr:uncharacterized protein BCR38DRAFT_354986 [Pseudomassariella vexata]ORY57150.1 hypothetical protein BCR38DRAFT_354986 [Pseudomassariella vexata]